MTRALFIHRSVGSNLINEGGVYQLCKRHDNLVFADYNQNTDMYRDGTGKVTKLGFSFPGNDTRPKDFAHIFSNNIADTYKPIQEFALRYDLLIIKSCYPNSNISNNTELEEIKRYYKQIANFISAFPEKNMVILTSPPLARLMTNKANATRARALASWLSQTNLAKNVSVMDFFDLLAEPVGTKQANRLRKSYRRLIPLDSHPNKKASKVIAPKFVQHIANL